MSLFDMKQYRQALYPLWRQNRLLRGNPPESDPLPEPAITTHEIQPLYVKWLCIWLLAVFMVCCQIRCAHAQEYTDIQYVNAIRLAEGNWTYGIKTVECKTPNTCRNICLNTVHNNKKRYARYGHRRFARFILFLASRYCPIGAGNDPKGLNKNWIKNVKYFLRKESLK